MVLGMTCPPKLLVQNSHILKNGRHFGHTRFLPYSHLNSNSFSLSLSQVEESVCQARPKPHGWLALCYSPDHTHPLSPSPPDANPFSPANTTSPFFYPPPPPTPGTCIQSRYLPAAGLSNTPPSSEANRPGEGNRGGGRWG